ncbi:MAG: hypothetical protein LRZ85_08800 [Alphaproteobacteria bacterium]|nr:hypothetical protein [Alphaproteobacteria bacterium]
MICPFAPREKQALLEAPTKRARAEILFQLLEFETGAAAQGNLGTTQH